MSRAALLESLIQRSRGWSSPFPTRGVALEVGVDTAVTFSYASGTLTAGPAGSWGGAGYHSGLQAWPYLYFNPKHGCRYILQGTDHFYDWIFEDTNSVLDLTSWLGTSAVIKAWNVVYGRGTVTLSYDGVLTISDPQSSSAPTCVELVFSSPVPWPDGPYVVYCSTCGHPLEDGSCVNPYCPAGIGPQNCPTCSHELDYEGVCHNEYCPDGGGPQLCPTCSHELDYGAGNCLNQYCPEGGGPQYCPTCGGELDYDSGQCTDTTCPECPDYQPPVEYCDQCGWELSDGTCINPDCPANPEYVEPEA